MAFDNIKQTDLSDIRELIFKSVETKPFTAVLTAESDGVLSGVESALMTAQKLGIDLIFRKTEGDALSAGEEFAVFSAVPLLIAKAEEMIIGTLAKASGIASAAKQAVRLADGRVKIVSGAWKKMPPEIKHIVRNAITAGGASFRIAEPPMVYIDKNYVRMLGSVRAALSCVENINAEKIIQLRGESMSIGEEAVDAARGGASILMIDTGDVKDIELCVDSLNTVNARPLVSLAFAGNVKIEDIPELSKLDIDILDIGKAIVDAPLLDMKLDVVREG